MTKGERHAFLLLIFMTLAIIAWPMRESSIQTDFSKLDVLADSLAALKNQDNSKPITLHNFNPNTAEIKDLNSLGFPAFLSTRIVNYRKKVGPFRYKSDLLRIYGMDTLLYQRIYTYILLPEKSSNPIKEFASLSVKRFVKPVAKIELNSADSTSLESLPCIGAKLAVRIIKYRDKLGGFYSINQLKEVYGLDSSCLPSIIIKTLIDTNLVAKLDINTIEYEILASHPYAGKYLAQRIINYRNQHGAYKSFESLENIKSLDLSKLKRLKPYLLFK